VSGKEKGKIKKLKTTEFSNPGQGIREGWSKGPDCEGEGEIGGSMQVKGRR